MPSYYYKAKNKNAVTVIGQVVAETRAEAVEQVSQLGLLPITVTEEGGRNGLEKSLRRNRRVSAHTQYLFTRQLHNLVKSGVPILRALEIIALQQKNVSFREVIESVRLAVLQGRSFSDSLAEYPQLFPGLYISMIKAGEESGTLKEVLKDLAEYQRNQQETISKVKAAFAYPAMMFFFGVGTVFFILTYVMPQITKLFDNLQQALPLPTMIVMQLSAWASDGRILFGFVFVLVLFFAGLQNFLKTKNGQSLIGNISLGVPGIGSFLLKVDMARFARTLELLLQSGVPIVKAIKMAIPVVSNEVVRQELRHCHDELVAGKSFGESLRACPIIPDIVGYLVVVGEESGSLSQTLHDMAENYEQEIQDSVKVCMSLLEPLMIVLIGGVVGFLIMAMLLPIFQMDIFAQ